MTSAERIVAAASRLASPGASEASRLDRLSRRVLERARAAGSKHPEVKGAALGGSFAKGTWLPGRADLDVFVRIDPKTPEARFEEVGLAVGAEALRGYPLGKRFAQHPYTEAEVEGVKVNVVPCYDVQKGHWKSAADRSLFHLRLVKAFPEAQKGEVRLLKLFMAGVGVYGAEIEVQGFSGYAAEVIVMQAGTFLSAMRRFAGVTGAGGPFSLRDPVDEERDLSTAISEEKLASMRLAARAFLRSPSIAYFKGVRGKERPAVRKRVVAVAFEHAALPEDALWGELKKTLAHLVLHLEGVGFKVARSLAASDNSSRSALLLIPEVDRLPDIQVRLGPTSDRKADVEAFVRSNRRSSELVWVAPDGRVAALTRRKYTVLEELLADLAQGKAGPFGASKEVAAGLRSSAMVLKGGQLEKKAAQQEWLGRGVRQIVSDTLGTRPG